MYFFSYLILCFTLFCSDTFAMDYACIDQLSSLEETITQGLAEKETLFVKALMYNENNDLIIQTLDQGIDLKAYNALGMSVMHIMMLYASTEILSLIFKEYQCSFTIQTNKECSFFSIVPLRSLLALSISHPRASYSLYRAYEQTPLHLAVLAGRYNVIELLLNTLQCDINAQDSNGYTALHYAVICSFSEPLLKLLADHASSAIDIQDKQGWTPLHYAIYRGDVPCTSFLLSKNASLFIQDNEGVTAFELINAYQKRAQSKIDKRTALLLKELSVLHE